MFHGWMFDPDGDQAAADSTRSSTSLDTGSSVNPRTARRLVTASYTSMIAYLPLIGFFQSGLSIHSSGRGRNSSSHRAFSFEAPLSRRAPAGEICGRTLGRSVRLLSVSGGAIRRDQYGRGALRP